MDEQATGTSTPNQQSTDTTTIGIGGLRVHVAPGLTVDLGALPPWSIALDGVVQGPELDLDAHRLSFDHHGGCIRLVTSATCRQVTDALLLGLDPTPYTAYVNDLDADTVLATALLAHPGWLAAGAGEATVVRRVVDAVGGRDAHGPAYPLAEPDLLAVFAARVPLPDRRTPLDASMMAAELTRCVDAVAGLVADLATRPGGNPADNPAGGLTDSPADAVPSPTRMQGSQGIQQISGSRSGVGTGPASPVSASVSAAGGGRPPASYTVTHRGTGWVMATSDADAFDVLYADRHTRAVMWRALADGSTAYTVGRRSDLVDGFPVGPASRPGTILAALAAREPGWGGGSSIGGAPRHPGGRRSALPPDEVFAIVEAVVTST